LERGARGWAGGRWAEPGIGGGGRGGTAGMETGSDEAAEPRSVGKPGSGEPLGPGERSW
jgi:hypothetical protein